MFDLGRVAGAVWEDKEGTAGHSWTHLGTPVLVSLGEGCDSQEMEHGKARMTSWREDDVTGG